MNRPLVAVTIPTANLGQNSLLMLDKCLKSIEGQDYPYIQIVISDHSEDDDIGGFLYRKNWNNRVDLVYTKFSEGRGMGVINMNNAWDHVRQDAWIFPFNQDDYLNSKSAITRMVLAIEESDKEWAACGCNHVDDDYQDIGYNHPPRWVEGPSMALGLNHIGSLSVVMFKNIEERQNVDLTYLNDCEFYFRIGQKYGPPALIDDLLVTIMMRKDSVSNTRDIPKIKAEEQKYLRDKYGW